MVIIKTPKRLKFRTILRLLLSLWATGIGLRFVISILQGGMVYPLSSNFDLVFDWGILMTLGLLSWVIFIYDYLKEEINAKCV